MQTFVRLKRPLEISPSDTLILNCNKKQKLESSLGVEGSLTTVLKFSGTQNSQNDDIAEHVTTLKNNLKQKILQKFKHDLDLKQKLRLEAQEHSKSDRYKIVNCLRSNLSMEDPDNCVTVLDIEPHEEVHKTKSDEKYVYDIYYTDAKIVEEVGDFEISILPTSEIFDSEDVYNNESDQESEDSNAENYYTNDYPDESDVESVNENDMIKSMNRIGLDDLSSTDDEYLHFNESKEEYFHDESDQESSYGTAFRKFKQKYGSSNKFSDESSLADAGEENHDSD
ncbi:probable RNA polymerase II nuclear localization protein SLC7A6OS [Coccinella septempunctata]|uniref:probable RNA polymerase II nuclear localization protein SLC7A6OS n=1 Tax=Coccinella septempunctata TaxID=41139 RepID=UPI001D067241|nr:probable RNA polymerase II nuclear localization protein SLC7A6OS [Coccinella septempunctata]